MGKKEVKKKGKEANKAWNKSIGNKVKYLNVIEINPVKNIRNNIFMEKSIIRSFFLMFQVY